MTIESTAISNAIAGIGHNNPPADRKGRVKGQATRRDITNTGTLKALKTDTRVCENLWLRVKGARGRSWMFKKTHPDFGTIKIGLGSYDTLSLTEARDKVLDFRRMLARNEDPRVPVVVHTFASVLPLWKAKAEHGWTNERYGRSVLTEIDRYVLEMIGDMDVNKITPADVVAVLMQDVGIEDAPFWLTRHVTCYRVKGYIREIIGYAMGMGWRDQGKGNPAAWEDNLVHLLADPKRIHAPTPHPSIHHSEIALFMKTLRSMKGLEYRCLESLIHCGLRTSEAMGARWPELDLDNATWEVPGSRMKKRKPHVVPLSTQAVALFRALQKGAKGDLVFGDLDPEALRGATAAVMTKAGRQFKDKKTGEIAVPHGFRSSLATWAADTGFDDAIIDLALAHTVGSDVLRRYQRSDKIDQRRKLMQQWSDHLAS